EEIRADEEVDLLEHPVALVRRSRSDPVEHEKVPIAVDVDLRALMAGSHVLDRERVEVKPALEGGELRLVGSVQIGIEEPVRGRQMAGAARKRNLPAGAVGSKENGAGGPAFRRFDAFGPPDLPGIHLSEKRHVSNVSNGKIGTSADAVLQVYTLENRRLENFLERHKAYYAYTGEIEIDRFLREILQKANEFVPSEAGSILLDDPMTKNSDDRLENELVFIATYGAHGESRLGKRMNARVGIVGHVYATGVAYMTDDVVEDPFFYPTLDLSDGFQTKSALCVPIRIESSVCGVLELVNRTGPGGFREKDRRLLEIFAEYASISIQNLLDARRAYEVAKRDGLTGLYNERYLHLRLTQELSRISRDGGDLCVIFLDLDNLKH